MATLAQASFQFVRTHRFFGLSLCDNCQIVEIVHEASIALQREDDTSPLPLLVRDVAPSRHRTADRVFREHEYLIAHQREPCREIALEEPVGPLLTTEAVGFIPRSHSIPASDAVLRDADLPFTSAQSPALY